MTLPISFSQRFFQKHLGNSQDPFLFIAYPPSGFSERILRTERNWRGSLCLIIESLPLWFGEAVAELPSRRPNTLTYKTRLLRKT